MYGELYALKPAPQLFPALGGQGLADATACHVILDADRSKNIGVEGCDQPTLNPKR